MRVLTAAVLIAAMLGGCSGLTELREERVDSSYARSSLRWDGGGRLIFALRTTEADGRVKLCGAYSAIDGGIYREEFNQKALESTSIMLDGDNLVTGLVFLKESGRGGRFSTASCSLTDTDWRAAHAGATPVLELGRTNFQHLTDSKRFDDTAHIGAPDAPDIGAIPPEPEPERVTPDGSKWVVVE